MSKNLINKVMVRESPPNKKTQEMIKKIESGYLVGRETKKRTKKSFSPSTLVYGNGKCFAGETEFLTVDGYKTLESMCGKHTTVWTGPNYYTEEGLNWMPAVVERFGNQEIWELVVERHGILKTIRTTETHRWIAKIKDSPSKPSIIETKDLIEGMVLKEAGKYRVTPKITNDGIRHGLTFLHGSTGTDGSIGSQTIAYFSGPRQKDMVKFFENGDYPITGWGYDKVRGLPKNYLRPPNLDESFGYLYGFAAGVFLSKGSVVDGKIELTFRKEEHLNLLRNVLAVLRIDADILPVRIKTTPFEQIVYYGLRIIPNTVNEKFFLCDEHLNNFKDVEGQKSQWPWTVVRVRPTGQIEEVFCVVEPVSEQFTIDGGILTKNCPRYWYYAFDGADFADDHTPYSVANMTSGTMSHERLQKAMKDSGIMIEDEVKVICDDPPIFGFADGMLRFDDEDFVAEIKTMREESFNYRKQANKPPPYHLEQILIYMKILKQAKGVLIYESKNSHKLHLIEVEINDDYISWVNTTFDWMRNVRATWENKELPCKPYRSNSKVCKGCPVKETCFSGEKGVVKIAPLEPLKA